MTSSTGTGQHPEVDEISALTEGLLPPGRTAAVRDHLAGCVVCADVLSSLDEIRALLGTLPAPQQMPADTAHRIDAALAAEALLASAAPDTVSRETSTDGGHRTTAAGGQSAPKAFPVSRETPTQAHPSRPGRRTSRPDGRRHAQTRPGRHSRGRRRWRTVVVSAACTVAAIGLGLIVLQQTDSADGGSSAHTTASERSGKAGHTRLSGSGLEPRVRNLLAQSDTTARPSQNVGAESEPNQPMEGSATTIPSCVRKGIGRSDSPLGVDQVRYKGANAYLVVLPRAAETRRVDVYVVDSSCISRSPQGPGKLLLQDIYQRN